MPEEVVLLDGMDRMDFVRVTEMLSKAFWSEQIHMDEVKKGAAHSALVVGAFLGDIQVGYARAVSDKIRFGYLMDVYVDEPYRRKGIGQKMVHYILEHPELKDVYQWLLITKDAHGVYKKCGFVPVSRPLDWMEIRRPRPVRG